MTDPDDLPRFEKFRRPDRRMDAAHHGRRHFERTCAAKRGYESKWRALAVIEHAKAKGWRGCETLRTYACPECGRWHLTKMDRDVFAELEGFGRVRRGR